MEQKKLEQGETDRGYQSLVFPHAPRRISSVAISADKRAERRDICTNRYNEYNLLTLKKFSVLEYKKKDNT